MFSYHVQSSDLEVHDCEVVFHLFLFDCRALLLADRPEDVGQRLVHLRHVLVVQIVDVDGDLGDRKLLEHMEGVIGITVSRKPYLELQKNYVPNLLPLWLFNY